MTKNLANFGALRFTGPSEVSCLLTETNLILNPLHPDAGELRISPARRFQFDPRMWK
jgi:hypothetical protein